MKKVQSLLIVMSIITIGAFTSCEKEDSTLEETLALETQKSVQFTYKNSTYLAQLNADGELDKSSINKDVLKAINTGYILDLNKENTVHLFDQEEELNEYIAKNYTSPSTTTNKMAGVATCTTYQHWYYGGFPLAGSNNFSYPSLRPYGFNDLISSAIITNYSNRGYLVKFYKHDNYRGSFYTKIVNPNTVASIANFRAYGLNDEISSITGVYL